MANWFTNLFRRTEKYSDVTSQLRSAMHKAVSSVEVNENTALNLVAVWAAIRVLSEDVASLPFPVYRRLNEGGKEIDRSHPLHYLLNVSPDGEITGLQFREYMMKCLNSYGNSYSEIERSKGKELLGLHRLDPSTVTPQRNKKGKIEYKVEGSTVPVPFERMLHIPGLGDGLVGLSPIKQAKQAISSGLMMDQFGAAWFANGSKGGMIITHPGELGPSAKRNILDSLDEMHGGPTNFGKNMIFEEGMTASPTSIPPEDAQFLATRTFNIQEICRLFRIPCTLLQENSRSTFSNSEQEALNYEKFGIRPWLERIEAQINFKLFNRQEQEIYFAEHVVDGLLRADVKTRYDVYNIAKNGGWLNADEIRELENRNPLPAGQGKIYTVPLNMADAAKVAEESPSQETDSEPTPEEQPPEEVKNDDYKSCNEIPEYPRAAPHNAILASRAAFVDSLDRMHRREAQAIERASKNPRQFLDGIDDFYSKHAGIMARAIKPTLDAYMALLGASRDAQPLSDDLCRQHREQLLALSGDVTLSELAPAVSLVVDRWKNQSSEIVAQLAT